MTTNQLKTHKATGITHGTTFHFDACDFCNHDVRTVEGVKVPQYLEPFGGLTAYHATAECVAMTEPMRSN